MSASRWLLPLERVTAYAARYRCLVAFAIIVASVVWLLSLRMNVRLVGDVGLYYQTAGAVLENRIPYRDAPLEYPPYVIPLFLIPRMVTALDFGLAFSLFMLVADLVTKGTLLVTGCRSAPGLRGIAPVTLYSLGSFALGHFYLHRYDIWPALCCLAAVIWFRSGRFCLAGAILALGIGLKLYPAVLLPPLFFAAIGVGKQRRFLAGALLGLLPLLLLALVLPWWRFAQIHAVRGLQVESLYASLLWAGKLCGWWPLRWEEARACKEVHGALASMVLPYARVISASAVILSVAVASRAAAYSRQLSLSALASLLLVPLLGFVAFNPVFSPQYLIWLLPFAALAAIEKPDWPGAAILVATLITPVFYPSVFHDYSRAGLGRLETSVLVARDLLLVGVWVKLVGQTYRSAKTASPQPVRPQGDSTTTVPSYQTARGETGAGA